MRDVRLLLISLLLASAVPQLKAADVPPVISRDQLLNEADDIANAQLKALGTKTSTNWIWGVMEVGYANYAHISPSGSTFSNALTTWAEKAKWTPAIMMSRKKPVPTFADSLCIGQTFLDLYAAHPSPDRIDPFRKRLDLLVEQIKAEPEHTEKLTWYWCDALFMAPPGMARMSAITGNSAYIDAMDTEYWRTTAALYDPQEHLFYRDKTFIGKLDPNGKKIFWARGEGWVTAGLALVLQDMPADYPTRPKYVTLFKDMIARIAPLQSADGTWHASLLDPDAYDMPETSGTALFVYAIAWGINNGILDRQTYLPIISRAWAAMISDLRPDGLPGWVEQTASAPKATKPAYTQLYATGAMLLDATELAKLAPINASLAGVQAATLKEESKIKDIAQPTSAPKPDAATTKPESNDQELPPQ